MAEATSTNTGLPVTPIEDSTANKTPTAVISSGTVGVDVKYVPTPGATDDV